MDTKRKVFKFFILINLVFLSIWIFSNKENQEKFIQLIENPKAERIVKKGASPTIEKTFPLDKNIINLGYYNGLVLWDGEGLVKLNRDYEKIKEKKFDFEDLDLFMGDNHIYIYDKSIGEINILNKDLEIINKIQVDQEIKNITESFNNTIIHMDEIYGESIMILDKNTEVIEKIITENRKILNLNTSIDGSKYIISTLGLGESQIKSYIQAFRLGGEELFFHEFQDEIIIYSKYLDRDKLLVATEKGLYCIFKDKILWEKSYKSLKDLYLDGDNIHILYSNSLEVINKKGEVRYKINLAESYKKIIRNKDTTSGSLILYGDRYIIGFKGEDQVFKIETENEMKKVINHKDQLIILYEDKLEVKRIS